jgi:uncharacterized protein (TIGR02677 family)
VPPGTVVEMVVRRDTYDGGVSRAPSDSDRVSDAVVLDQAAAANGPIRRSVFEPSPVQDLATSPTAVSPARDAGFHHQPLQRDEREVLKALRSLTVERADVNLAVLAALADAQAVNAAPSFRTDEVASLVAHLDEADVAQALEDLEERGCVRRAVDVTRLSVRISDFYRQSVVWWLTPVGSATHAAALSVLDAVGRAGGLRRRLLGELRSGLELLGVAVTTSDASGVAQRLGGLAAVVGEISDSNRDFFGVLSELYAAAEIDSVSLDQAKLTLVEYLTNFSTDIERLRGVLIRLMRDLEAVGADRIAALAAAGDEGADVILGPNHGDQTVERYRRMYDSVAAWVLDTPEHPAHLSRLTDGLTAATRRLLDLLRRSADARRVRASRTFDLQNLASAFAAVDDDGLVLLADAAFGLGRSWHLSGHTGASTSRRPSWWDGPHHTVLAGVRRRGANRGTGRVAAIEDRSRGRAVLEAQAAAEAQARVAAEAELLVGPLSSATLSADALKVLLDTVDASWSDLFGGGPGAAWCPTGTARLWVRPRPGWCCRIQATTGTLEVLDFQLAASTGDVPGEESWS